MKFADYIVGMLATGIMILLCIVILGDYMIAMRTDRVLDPEIITLMKMSITGLIGIIGGYLGGKQSTKDDKNE
jgi:hypothetical protein|tara:strand:- start:759 stop:977 length:219 start_codon:yes stop_codon:yes gene_type:complete